MQHMSQLRRIRERRVPTGVQHLADYPARVIPAYGSAGTPARSILQLVVVVLGVNLSLSEGNDYAGYAGQLCHDVGDWK